MINIKLIPYENNEKVDRIYFLNPAQKEIKTEIINKCSNHVLNYEEINELIDFLETVNTETLMEQKSVLIINRYRFECLSA